uniref:pre-mRNA-splicing regulator WTAP n=1 Tax=Myxine glutinosa TaxID=7769 RepID=UPI00358F1137
MAESEPATKRVRISEDELKTLPRDDLSSRWKQQECYLQGLESRLSELSSSDWSGLKESEERLKQQQQEALRRENILLMRLATKEQEMQECATQIHKLKHGQRSSAAQLRSCLVEPAVNLLFTRMRSELQLTRDRLQQAHDELNAWKFTPDSQTGKKLMAKCRMLIQENQDLGRQLAQGRVAQLEAELALQKKYGQELKCSQDELNEFIIQLDEEVEGMQSTILVLQQQLRDAREQLELKNAPAHSHENGSATPSSEPDTAVSQMAHSPCGATSGANSGPPTPASSSTSSEEDKEALAQQDDANGQKDKKEGDAEVVAGNEGELAEPHAGSHVEMTPEVSKEKGEEEHEEKSEEVEKMEQEAESEVKDYEDIDSPSGSEGGMWRGVGDEAAHDTVCQQEAASPDQEVSIPAPASPLLSQPKDDDDGDDDDNAD